MPKIELTKAQLAALDLVIATMKADDEPIAVDLPMGFIGDVAHDFKHAVEKGAHVVGDGVKDAYHAISGGSADAAVKGDLHKKIGEAKPGKISLNDLIEIRKLFK